MQTVLAWIVLAVAIIGLAYANFSPRGRQAHWTVLREHRLLWLPAIALLLTAILTLLTIPGRPPFTEGMRLGWGFLIGGVLGVIAIFHTVGETEENAWIAQMVGILSAAIFGPALVFLLFGTYPQDALIGCALGGVLVAIIGSSVMRFFPTLATNDSPTSFSPRGLEIFGLATATIAAAGRLGIEHNFPRISESTPATAGYWAVPAVLVAVSVLVFMLFTRRWPGIPRPWFVLISGLVASIVTVIVTLALQTRLFPGLKWSLPAFGLLAFSMLLAVMMLDERDSDTAKTAYRPMAMAFGSVLLAMALAAVAFKFLAGYGEGLALAGALPIVAAPFLARVTREQLVESMSIGAFSILLLLMLFRTFLETSGRGWALDFQQQYNLLALLFGFGATFALLGVAEPHGAATRLTALSRQSLRVLGIGVIITLSPVVFAALWGVRGVSAYLAGLIIGEVGWMLLAAWTTTIERVRVLTVAPHLFLVAAMLVAIQFTPFMLALHLSRARTIGLVVTLIAIAVVWVVGANISRLRKTAV